MNSNFAAWLQNQLDRRGWSQRELARQIRNKGDKVTSSQLNRILRGENEGTAEVIIAIAKGLELSNEEVFRARGWLPSQLLVSNGGNIDPRIEQLAKELNALPKESRDVTLNAMESMLEVTRYLTNTSPDFSQDES